MRNDTPSFSTQSSHAIKAERTTDEKSQEKITTKKMRLAKFGPKFQSAGTLMSISDQIGKDTPIKKTHETTPLNESSQLLPREESEGVRTIKEEVKGGDYTTKWDREGAALKREVNPPPSVEKAPPPLMSRQRELTMEKYVESDSDEEGSTLTAKTIVKRTPTFKFKIGKN